MKVAVGILVFLWLVCGLIGASWLGDHRWKTIAKGPITLARAYNENPVSYPGP